MTLPNVVKYLHDGRRWTAPKLAEFVTGETRASYQVLGGREIIIRNRKGETVYRSLFSRLPNGERLLTTEPIGADHDDAS